MGILFQMLIIQITLERLESKMILYNTCQMTESGYQVDSRTYNIVQCFRCSRMALATGCGRSHVHRSSGLVAPNFKDDAIPGAFLYIP